VAVTFQESEPLVFLQSLEDPGLCFIAMPILSIDPNYKLRVAGDDLDLLGLPRAQQPAVGTDVLCLSVLSVCEGGPTANLLAPIVVNLGNRRAVQAVAPESDYSHQFALMPEEAAVCS
jgi:flagellar assembly factor FliW